jgi:hypothetical protein
MRQSPSSDIIGQGGHRLGTRFETDRSITLSDRSMKMVGRYDKVTNTTYGPNGSYVGKGDLTLMLLGKSQK